MDNQEIDLGGLPTTKIVESNSIDLGDLPVVKKKDQGVLPSVSSATQSLSPDFEKGKAFAEKGFLMKGEGTKEQKRISFEPSFSNIVAPFKVKVLEEGEEPSFAADLMTVGARGQIQGKVANLLPSGKIPTNEELSEVARLQSDAKLLPQTKAEKVYQEKGLIGLFKENPELGVQYVAETMTSSFSALLEASKRTVPTAVAMGAAAGAPIAGVGGLIGAGVGLLGGQSAAGYNLSTSQDILSSLSENGVDVSDKESLIKAFSDEKKMAKIRDTAAKYGVPILAFDIATAGLAGKFLSGAMGKSLSKKLLAGLGETGIQIAGGSGGELAGQISSGKKINWDEIVLEGLAEVPAGISEVATGVAIERNKTASNNKTLATQIAYQGTENGVQDAVVNLNRDLANKVITPEQYQQGLNFVEKAAQVSDKVPENVVGDNRANSIELLVERNNIKEINQNLLQQKQNTDEAYHIGIDKEIKANEERLKKLDSEIYDISKKPIEEKVRPEIKITEEEITPEQEVTVTEEVKPTEVKETIKTEKNAIQEPSTGEILQRQQEAVGETGGERTRVEPSIEGQIPTQEGKQVEVNEKEITPSINVEKRLFTTSKKNTVDFEDGKLVVRDRKGQALSERASKSSLLEYADNFDFSVGKQVEVPQEIIEPREQARYAIEKTENPLEVASIYFSETPMPLENDKKMQAIAEYGLGRIKTSSYNRFGDSNKIEKSMYLNIFSEQRGRGIDQIAQEISKEGLQIDPEDIVKYIEKYSKGDKRALELQETDLQLLAKDKFKELTGLELTPELSNKILDKELQKANQEQLNILKQDYETAKELEDAYWSEYEKTDGFTKESPVSEVNEPEPTEKEVKSQKINEFLYTGTEDERQKALLKNLMNSDVPKSYKKGLEELGLNYKVSNSVEASEAAKAIIKSLGVTDALDIARAGKIDASVGSAIYGESLNNIWSNERKLKADGKIDEAKVLAKQWADVSVEYANSLNYGGKMAAQLAYFYKTSPMGFAMRIENEKTEEFEAWYKDKEKDYKKAFAEILKSEEGQALLKEEVEKISKEERAKVRADKRQKIDEFFENAKLKGNNLYAIPIPPKLINSALEVMKKAVLAGESVANAVSMAVEHISKEVSNWDKEKFRKEYESKLSKITEEKSDADLLASRIKSLETQIAEYKKKISEGGAVKAKVSEKFADNQEVRNLKQERDALQKENQNLLKEKKEGRYSDEAKLAQSEKRVLKSIEDLEKKIEDNDLEIEKPEKLSTPELEQLKGKQKKLREELNDKRKEAGVGKFSEEAKYDARVRRNKDRIAELNRRMEEGDFSSEVYKAKKEKDVLDKELDEVKAKYDEAKEKSPEYIDKKAKQYLDRLRQRLKGVSEEQKEQIIRRSIKEIVNKGGLEYQDFKDIVSETIGVRKLTDEQKSKIESLTEQSNIADDLEQKFLDNPTRESLDAFIKAKSKSLEADKKLFDMTSQKADIIGTLKSLITLNYLSLSTIIKNYSQNLIYQGTVRFPQFLAKKGAEQSVYGATYMANKMFGTKVINPGIGLKESQKIYLQKYQDAIIGGWDQMIKGIDEKDYFATNAYASSIRPQKSLNDLKDAMKGELFLTKNQKVDKWIQATLGWQANAISRLMIYGDKPPRYAAQAVEAMSIAHKELGITEPIELEAFMLSPEKYSYKHLIEKAKLSSEEASKYSQLFKKRIIDAGAEATFQNENLFNDLFAKLDEGLKLKKEDRWSSKIVKVPLSILKATQLPYIKTPANVAWAFFKIANPSLTLIKSLTEAGIAQNSLRKGDLGGYREYIKKSKESFGLFAVGITLTAVAATFASKGLIRTSIEDDDKAREKAGEGFFGKSNELNLGGLIGGDDYWVDLSWFGPVGTMLDIRGRMMEDNRQKELKGEKVDDGFINEIIPTIGYSVSATLNTLVFDQGAKMVDAIKKGNQALNQIVVNNTNALGNIFFGGTLPALNKALAPEKMDLAADNVIDQIINNQKQRNIFVTWAAGYPPSKVSIWGEPISQDRTVSGVLGSMLGFEKGSADKFGAILYNEQRRTGINEFFPPVEDKKIKVNGKDVTITVQEKRDLDAFIGQARKNMVSPFINDKSIYTVFLKNGEEVADFTYSDLTKGKNILGQTISQAEADRVKLAALSVIYENGKKAGFSKFKEKYKQYQDAELNVEKIQKQALESAEKTIFKAKIEEEPE